MGSKLDLNESGGEEEIHSWISVHACPEKLLESLKVGRVNWKKRDSKGKKEEQRKRVAANTSVKVVQLAPGRLPQFERSGGGCCSSWKRRAEKERENGRQVKSFRKVNTKESPLGTSVGMSEKKKRTQIYRAVMRQLKDEGKGGGH